MKVDKDDWSTWVGQKVYKKRGGRTPKPFKSGLRFNTVHSIGVHPKLGKPTFLFEEDESYVLCRKCDLVTNEVQEKFGG
ncbi:MAG TPA: hypothetical protein VFM18_07390 [Methanosarcina sp.]|nr:hypothetical protein [Methanosarcina sp.]